MAIIKADSKKQYAIEHQPMLRILASGNKLTNAIMSAMDLKSGIAQEKNPETKEVTVEGKPGDSINYAIDDESGDLFIYKTKKDEKGSVIGATKSFTNTSLKSELLKRASGAEIKNGEKGATISLDTPIKKGLQVRFAVSETPVLVDGTDYFKVTFKEAVVTEDDSEDEAKEEATSEAKPTAKAEADSNW